MRTFGGDWTDRKVNAFIKYVKAYSKIFSKQKWAVPIYFDGFSGDGSRIIRKKDDNIDYNLFKLFEVEYEQETEIYYKSTVERILEIANELCFKYYYFIDKSQRYSKSLKKIIDKKFNNVKAKIIVRSDDCNNQLMKLSKVLKDKKSYTALIFLDPFGMQINWNAINCFDEQTKADVWLLVPSGVAVNRFISKNKNFFETNIDKLENFFGLSTDELTDIVYVKQRGLFNNEETIKVEHPIEKIIKIYKNQLKKVFKYVIKPLELRNSKNQIIYHFIFASNNKTGAKIAQQIVEG